jgi:hypothetical protein
MAAIPEEMANTWMADTWKMAVTLGEMADTWKMEVMACSDTKEIP